MWFDIIKLRRKIPTGKSVMVNGIEVREPFEITNINRDNMRKIIKRELTGNLNDDTIDAIIENIVKRYNANKQHPQAPRNKEQLTQVAEKSVGGYALRRVPEWLKVVYGFNTLLLIVIMFEEFLGFMNDSDAIKYTSEIATDLHLKYT